MFCFCFFKTDCSHAVETISVLVMTTVRRQGGIIQIHDNRITRLTENVSKTKNCIKQVKKCKKKKKKSSTVARKTKKCSNFAQKSRKCSINAGNVKSAEKVPSAIGTCLITVVSNFPCVLQSSQVKSKTIVMQNREETCDVTLPW